MTTISGTGTGADDEADTNCSYPSEVSMLTGLDSFPLVFDMMSSCCAAAHALTSDQ
jgi:hypothetical protein